MMTVGELKDLLADVPDNLVVLIAGDPEGNEFHHASEIGEYLIDKDEAKRGRVDDVHEIEDIDDEDREFYEPRLVLWP